jgi:hypothetical protein
MLFDRFATVAQLSDFRERVQRLETENASLRARVESDALDRYSAAHTAAVGSIVGWAIESFARAVRTPARRGRAGGLARAQQASDLGERWSDGRFMAHEDWEEIEREISEAEYMRHAAGGFARAATAVRATDGRFATKIPARAEDIGGPS